MTTEVFSACSWLVGIFEEQSSGRIVGARREFPDSETLCFLEQGEVIKDASTYTAWAVSHIGELLTQCWTREEDQAARNWISFTCSACCVCAMSRTSLKSLIRKINLDDHYSRVTWGASKIEPDSESTSSYSTYQINLSNEVSKLIGSIQNMMERVQHMRNASHLLMPWLCMYLVPVLPSQ